jgi:hypothetical protein
MKSHAFRKLLFLVPLLFIVLTCNKDKDDENKFRIIAEEYYYNDDKDGESTYEYLDNKISEFRYEEDEDYYEEATFDYSEEDKIYIENVINDYGDESIEEMEITLEDGRIIEFIDDDDEKYTVTYNASDQIDLIKIYEDDGGDWIMYATVAFDYEGDKLMELIYESMDDDKEKIEYTYDGDFVDEIYYSYYYDGDWFEEDKDVYSYTSGKVSKITYYEYYDGEWEKDSWYEEFEYDENGNLVKSMEIDNEYDEEYVTEYTYEKGPGNYRLIFGNFYFMDEGFVDYPMPTKSALRDADISDIKSKIGLCKSLRDNRGLTGSRDKHINRFSAGHSK